MANRGLTDINVTKTWRDGRAYFESYVDALKNAIGNVSSITNLNLVQLAKDISPSYSFTNNGTAYLAKSLQEQINDIQAGGVPITGTTSNDFTIRSASNYLKFNAATLTTPVVLTSPNESGEMVLGAATQTLTNKTLTSPVLTTPQINNPALTFQYVFAGSAIAADRTVTLPLLTAGDTFVMEAFTQTLTNKTLTSPVLTTPQINNPALTFQYVFAGSAIAADRTVTLPLLTADDTFVMEAFTQTLTNKTLTSPVLTTPQINNPALTFQYIFAGSAIAADRTVTLPLLTAGDTFVMEAFTQTLSNKTFSDGIVMADIDPPTANEVNRNGNVKVWLNYQDGVGILDSYNITSVTDEATAGYYTVTIDRNFSSDNFAAVPSSGEDYFASIESTASSGASVSVRIDLHDGTGADQDFRLIAIGDQ